MPSACPRKSRVGAIYWCYERRRGLRHDAALPPPTVFFRLSMNGTIGRTFVELALPVEHQPRSFKSLSPSRLRGVFSWRLHSCHSLPTPGRRAIRRMTGPTASATARADNRRKVQLIIASGPRIACHSLPLSSSCHRPRASPYPPRTPRPSSDRRKSSRGILPLNPSGAGPRWPCRLQSSGRRGLVHALRAFCQPFARAAPEHFSLEGTTRLGTNLGEST
jgi:hypothetical protein